MSHGSRGVPRIASISTATNQVLSAGAAASRGIRGELPAATPGALQWRAAPAPVYARYAPAMLRGSPLHAGNRLCCLQHVNRLGIGISIITTFPLLAPRRRQLGLRAGNRYRRIEYCRVVVDLPRYHYLAGELPLAVSGDSGGIDWVSWRSRGVITRQSIWTFGTYGMGRLGVTCGDQPISIHAGGTYSGCALSPAARVVLRLRFAPQNLWCDPALA